MVVLEKQKKRLKEAMDSKPAPVEDNLELKAMKAMGAMEEGDAIFGSNAEVNLDSEVPLSLFFSSLQHLNFLERKYQHFHLLGILVA